MTFSLTPVVHGSSALRWQPVEKTAQIVYEHNPRPAQKRHQPWLDRAQSQLAAAYRLLEVEIGTADPWLFGKKPLQADITSAVAWRFTREMLPE